MKHKHFKHLFTALLMLCATVATAHDFEVGGIYYNITNSTKKEVAVTYSGSSYDAVTNEYIGNVVIPKSVVYNDETYSVTSIRSWAFSYCTSLTSVEIPNSVTYIGDYAFNGCSGLANVVIPNGVTSFGSSVFSYCSSLTSIEIPNSVTSTGMHVFSYCTSLTSVEIPNSITHIQDYTFNACSSLTSVTIPNSVKSIGNSAFSGCSRLTSIEIPNSVTSIGNYAFRDCTRLTSLVIPNSVTSIRNGLFYGCSGLKSVVIGNSVKSIGSNAFYRCSSLNSIEIPSSVTNIGTDAFYNCSGLKEVHISDLSTWCNIDFDKFSTNPLYYAHNLYLNDNLVTELVIPNGVTSIGNLAFFYCTSLTSVEIPSSVTSIGDDAFSSCSGLKEVHINDLSAWCNIDFGNSSANPLTYAENLYLNDAQVSELVIPDGVEEIKNYAFYRFSGLTNIEIPNSVTSIGNYAFRDCTGLTSIEIPNSVTSIGDNTFYNCSGLTSVVIGNSVTSIGDNAFYNCSGLTGVVIGESVTSIGNYAFYCCEKLKTVFNCSNLTFTNGSSDYGCVAYYANKVYNVPNAFVEGDYVLGEVDGVNTLLGYLGNDAELTLPADYKGEDYVIGKSAFSGNTTLTCIVIPNSVTSIRNDAFYGCENLKTVCNFSNLSFTKNSSGYGYVAYYADKVFNTPNGSVEDDFIFGKLNDINTLFGYLGNNTELTLPDNYQGENYAIAYKAFYNCTGLTSIKIPNSVTSIGELAFAYCSALKRIDIPNGVTIIGNLAFYNCTSLTSVTIPNSVTSIENGAFTYCHVLNNVYINDLSAWCNIKFGNNSSNPTAKNFYLNDELVTELVIPEGVKKINNYAFQGCSSLTSVVIPNSVTSIGGSAFSGCSKLTSIEIPNSVTSIGGFAFEDCKALTSVVIGDGVTSIGTYAFSNCSGLKEVHINNLTAWCNIDFDNSEANPLYHTVNFYLNDELVTELVVPEGVKEIKKYAFKGCSSLTRVTISENVTSIGGGAFSGCSGLTSIEIPNSVTSIGGSAFYDCSKLTRVEIPNSVTSIGGGAFSGCSGLTSIEIPNSVTSIGGSAFYDCSKLTRVEIPNSVTSIGDYAFAKCTGLTSVEIGDGVTSVGYSAFNNCTSLTSVTIPNSVTSIGNEAFYGCTALETVINNSDLDIEKGSTSNGYVAYYANEVIANEFKFELVDGVYTLVKYRGKGIKQEETITFDSWTSTNKGQSSSTSSHKYTFDATAGSEFSFDWSVSSETNYDKLYVIFDGTTVLTESGVYSGNYEYSFTDAGSHTLEVKYTKDGSVNNNDDKAEIYNIKLSKTFYKPADVVLPDNYEGELYVIGESAFENNELVASVTIPEGVEMICDKAFSGCNILENIVIPNSVSAIGGDAFAGTKWYDNKEDGMVYAGNVLYKYKGSMPENTAITINDGTLGVAGLAFANCSGLTSITSLIPADNLFVPGSDAFVGVDKTNCTLYVPYGAKETYAATEGWEDFENIVEIIPAEITITINQYGCATYCSPFALDFSEVEGLKAYAATGYKSNSQVVTLTRVQTAKAGIGLFLKAEPGEYVVPVIESTDEHSLNLLVGTLEQTTVNSTDGAMSNYKFTIADGDTEPMFYPFEDNTLFSAGKSYLQIPTAWLPVTAQKSLNIRFDEGETTDIDEVEDENEDVKTVYDLQGRMVEKPTNGIYIIDGKKVIIK